MSTSTVLAPEKAGASGDEADGSKAILAIPVVVMVVVAIMAPAREYWLDEGYSLAAGHHLLDSLRGENGTMGAYYLMLSGWIRLSDAQWWVRSLSLATMGVAVFLFTVLVARQHSRAVAVRAGIFAATTYVVLEQTTEVRSYPLVCLLVVTSWTAVDHLIEDPSRRVWVALHVAVCAILPFAHGLALLQLAAQGAVVLVARPPWAALWRIGAGYVAAGTVLVALFSTGLKNEGSAAWIVPPSWSDLPILLRQLTNPSPELAVVVGAVMLVGAFIQVRGTLTATGPLARFRSFQPVGWGLLSVILLLVVCMVSPMQIPRYAIASAFGLGLLTAVAADHLDRLTRLPMATIALVVPTVISVAGYYAGIDRPWSTAIGVIEERGRAGDGVVFPTDDARLPFEANWASTDPDLDLEPIGTHGDLGALHRYAPDRTVQELATATVAPRVWVISQQYRHVPDLTDPYLEAVAPRYVVLEQWNLSEMDVYLIERRG